MSKKKKERRARRSFSREFKADVVRLCQNGPEPIGDVAKRLDLNETSVRNWIKQAVIDSGNGSQNELTSMEKEELTRLRREDKRLTMKRDILKKATALVAREGM